MFTHLSILTYLVFLPLISGFLILLIPFKENKYIKVLAIFTSILIFFFSLYLWIAFNSFSNYFQYRHNTSGNYYSLTGHFNLELGIDGLSLFFIVLTAFIIPLGLFTVWDNNFVSIYEEKFFLFLILLLETAILGTFSCLDLFFFYVFFELTLIPLFFLIGIWLKLKATTSYKLSVK